MTTSSSYNWEMTRNEIITDALALSGASGTGITLGTPQASTSGTSIDFSSIPATTKRITVNFVGVSTNGTSNYLIQIGPSGGVETSGYTAAGGNRSLSTSSSAGFIPVVDNTAALFESGSVVLTLENSSSNTWVQTGIVNRSDGQPNMSAGSKSLAGAISKLRITTVSGADTFDAGEINIAYE